MSLRHNHLEIYNDVSKGEDPYKIIPKILEALNIEIIKTDLNENQPEKFRLIKEAEGDMIGALAYSKPRDQFFIFLHKDGQTKPVFGYDLPLDGRERFTVMHELGHYFEEKIYLEKTEDLFNGFLFYRDDNSSRGHTEEQKASDFAANFLMPMEYIEKFMSIIFDKPLISPSQDQHIINALAKRFGVSKQAMLIRLKKMGKIVE